MSPPREISTIDPGKLVAEPLLQKPVNPPFDEVLFGRGGLPLLLGGMDGRRLQARPSRGCPPARIVLQKPMNDEVRVAADRRGEMGVILQAQAVMAGMFGRIFGQPQGPEDLDVDEFFDRRAFGGPDRGLKIAGGDPAGRGKQDVEEGQRLPELLEILLGRVVVDAMEGRDAAEAEIFGHGDVGRDHEFLDQLVGLVRGEDRDRGDFPFLVNQLRFDEVEIEAAAGASRRLRTTRASFLISRRSGTIGGKRGPLGRVVLQDLEDRRVRHPLDRPDDRGMERRADPLPVRVEIHDDGDGQAVDARPERAEVVGQPLRKHRQRQAGKIDARRPGEGFGVQGRPRPDVMGHVGDMDAEPPAAVARAGVMETASSKSWAVSPSIVNVVHPR